MENEIINYLQNDSKNFMWAGYQKLHRVLNIAQMPAEYYLGISKLFNGRSRAFFMLVINKMVTGFRNYQMPTEKDFKGYIFEIKADSKPFVAITHDPMPSESEKEKVLSGLSDIKDMLKKNGCSSVSAGKQKVLDRKARIKANIEAGLEYCEVAHEWMLVGMAKRAKVWFPVDNETFNENETFKFKEAVK